MTHTFGTRAHRRDRGATVVEAAIVAPVFFLLLLGLMAFAPLFKDHMSVGEAAHDAARQASASGSDPLADYNILTVAKRSLSALDNTITRLIVYRATTPDDPVPAACLAVAPGGPPKGVADLCNVYGPAELNANMIKFGFDPDYRNDPSLYDKYWSAVLRTDVRATAEFVGVYIEVRHEDVTGVLAGARTLRATVVVPYEARRGG